MDPKILCSAAARIVVTVSANSGQVAIRIQETEKSRNLEMFRVRV